MMSRFKKVLFVSHDATRTGAPIVLLHHLRELKSNYRDIAFDVFLKSGGELVQNFKDVAHTQIIPLAGFWTKIINKIFGKDYYVQSVNNILGNNYGLVYANTVVSVDVLSNAKLYNPSIVTVCHVHELDVAIKQFAGKNKFLDNVRFVDYFVAASKAVKEVLIEKYNIPCQKIEVYYEHIPLIQRAFIKEDELSQSIHAKSGLKICGSGTLDWRKGFDIFLQAAYLLKRKQKTQTFHFYWIGGSKNSIEYEKAVYDIEKMNLSGYFTLIESCTNPYIYINACDLFFLSSREDPFPLVCLEAASLGKPIFCFKNSGGMNEFVNESNGWITEYLDVGSFAKILEDLISDPAHRSTLDSKGVAALASAQEYDITKGGKIFNRLLQKYLAS